MREASEANSRQPRRHLASAWAKAPHVTANDAVINAQEWVAGGAMQIRPAGPSPSRNGIGRSEEILAISPHGDELSKRLHDRKATLIRGATCGPDAILGHGSSTA